ncbi:hypothetical protein CHU95_19120 [Niveispirillum lacus]|uniref:Solute-binding protein family 3/N-terminal domain-containing protein n=1 Tax=Niveispirillum lacus TaxID=1981099 RepID=A0A255YUH2_9PROT|nr:hypothetical protein [Niveispirillum lacus]OYQ32852.1 hypothetical protein CHU95_19120 [Niveispirillum lacus]
MLRKVLLLLLMILLSAPPAVLAETTTLRVLQTPEGNHVFFYELLTEAFAAAGKPVQLQGVSGPGMDRFKVMLRTSQLDVMWMVRGPRRDQAYILVDFPLTGGLIGQRILLIRKGDQARFDNIRSLDDFRQQGLSAGMGREWVDKDIWELNGLAVSPGVSDWRRLFKMLEVGNRGIDYLPRGALEVQNDQRANPNLQIERRLVLRYNRDSVFYLSPAAANLAPILKQGLERLRDNGRYAQLLEKHYGKLSRELGLDKRIVLPLRDIDDTTN